MLRKIGTYREEMQKGAALGQDCAFFSWKEASLVTTTQTVALPVKDAGRLAVYAADNNLAAAGAQTIGISLALTIPETLEEKELQELMRGIDDTCRELSIQISGGHTEISSRVNAPVISMTAFGYLKQKRVYESPSKEYDIIMSKFAAVEGTAILLETEREKLQKAYTESFLSGAAECAEHLSVRKEAAIAVESGVYAMHDLHQGGIFGALWELSRQIGVGLNVDLKKIPILQETVEICECLGVNPYQLISGGALLMAAADGEALLKELWKQGIPAALIGTTNAGNDKIICNEEEVRFLDKPGQDEIYRVFE
ncbi:MAG: AIR synthase related protein [Lachnospiraceae bacterium]|nr:AIR synthase related protein [Lachnospiraceae bacterium]